MLREAPFPRLPRLSFTHALIPPSQSLPRYRALHPLPHPRPFTAPTAAQGTARTPYGSLSNALGTLPWFLSGPAPLRGVAVTACPPAGRGPSGRVGVRAPAGCSRGDPCPCASSFRPWSLEGKPCSGVGHCWLQSLGGVPAPTWVTTGVPHGCPGVARLQPSPTASSQPPPLRGEPEPVPTGPGRLGAPSEAVAALRPSAAARMDVKLPFHKDKLEEAGCRF